MNKSQSLGMYIILGIMILAFVSMLFTGPTTTTEELSYTNFLQKLTNGEIKSVEMDKTFLIALPKVQPQKEKTKPAKKELPMLYGMQQATPTLQYKVLTPNDPGLMKRLEEANEKILLLQASEPMLEYKKALEENQQKEFVEWLENERNINPYDISDYTYEDIINTILSKYKEVVSNNVKDS